jgi:toluene monooxygenase electron transfer component
VTVLSFRIALAGSSAAFSCRNDQALLHAALGAGVPVPHECASGSCGTCKVELASGAVESRWPEAPGLSERDRRRGKILACQSEPRSDCVIRARLAPAECELPRPAELELMVTQLDRPAEGILHLGARADVPVRFLAGQFMLFRLPGGRRAYSMANPPEDGTRRLEFFIKAKPGGAATRTLFEELRVGHRLRVEGPLGRAFLRKDDAHDIVCVAGGSGIAPMLSIAFEAVRADGRNVDFFFGVRRPRDFFAQDLLERLAGSGRARVVTAVSEPDDVPPGGAAGLVGDVMRSSVPDLHERTLYMAGPPAMVDAVLRACVTQVGLSADRIHFDRFV